MSWSRWEGLEMDAYEGRVEIDNNACESASRQMAVGKKNWLFIGEAFRVAVSDAAYFPRSFLISAATCAARAW